MTKRKFDETVEGWSNEPTWAANFALTNEPGLHAKLWQALEYHARQQLDIEIPYYVWTPFKTDAAGNITGMTSLLWVIRNHVEYQCPEVGMFDGRRVHWNEIALDWATRLPEIKLSLREKGE